MKKKLFLIIGLVLIILSIGIGVFISLANASSKIVCKSKNGNITIFFDQKTLVGYTASGISYNLELQKTYAEKRGTDNYIEEFKVWFIENTEGSCTIKKR